MLDNAAVLNYPMVSLATLWGKPQSEMIDREPKDRG